VKEEEEGGESLETWKNVEVFMLDMYVCMIYEERM